MTTRLRRGWRLSAKTSWPPGDLLRLPHYDQKDDLTVDVMPSRASGTIRGRVKHMSYFTDKLASLRPLAEADAGFCRARSAFLADPSFDGFEAVCEWVAGLASPGDDNPELDGRFDKSWAKVVVCDYVYFALTEGLLGVTGYLRQRIQNGTRQDWMRSRAVLRRAGVPTAAGNHPNRITSREKT